MKMIMMTIAVVTNLNLTKQIQYNFAFFAKFYQKDIGLFKFTLS